MNSGTYGKYEYEKESKVKEMFSGCTAQKDDSATLAMDWTPSIVFLRLLALRPMI